MVSVNSRVPSYVTRIYGANPEGVKNLIRFAQGQPMSTSDEDTFVNCLKNTGSGLLIFEGGLKGLPFLNKIRKLKKVEGKGFKDTFVNYYTNPLKETNEAVKTSFDAFKTKDGSLVEKAETYWNKLTAFNEKSEAVSKTLSETVEEKCGKNFLGKTWDAIKTPFTWVGKRIGRKSAEKTTEKIVEKTAEKAAEKLTATSVLKKFLGMDAAILVGFEGLIDTFTEIVPTFNQLGKEAGMRQIAKTGTKVVASTVGWIGGEVAGKVIGGAICGTLGSAVPFLGTAVGVGIGQAIGGFVGGMVGSWATSKLAQTVTGKSELELAKEKEIEQSATAITTDQTQMNQLVQSVVEKVKEHVQTEGTITKEDEQALAELRKLGFNTKNITNPFTQGTIATA